MNIFQSCKLPDIATAEQSMATGVDEDGKKPRNLTDQVVRLLDDSSITTVDRLRLVMQYILHRDGIFPADLDKLLAHAQLPPQEGEMIQNLDLLGVRVQRPIKDLRPQPPPLFPRKPSAPVRQEDLSISRFEPAVKYMIEEQLRGTLDQELFPYTKPQLDADDAIQNQMQTSQASLRSAKPTWARTRPSASEPRQRVILFVAGGATYSEARVCYEISQQFNKDVYLTTSHMLTPRLFLKQLSDLSVDRRRLDLPNDRPPRKAPAHVFEGKAPQPQVARDLDPPTSGLAGMSMNSSGPRPSGGGPGDFATATMPQQAPTVSSNASPRPPAKITKEHKEKKRFFKF